MHTSPQPRIMDSSGTQPPPPGQPSAHISETPSDGAVQTWRNDLKEKYSFTAEDADPNCPSGHLMSFQAFTDGIIDGLNTRRPEFVQLVTMEILHDIYLHGDKPPFLDYIGSHGWFRAADMLHPYRRTPKAAYYLAITNAMTLEPDVLLGNGIIARLM
jgi:hypothetical protein